MSNPPSPPPGALPPARAAAATASAAAREIPDEFKCPITRELIIEPITHPDDGFTYERSALQRWWDEGKRTSPATRETLTVNPEKVKTNVRLRDRIKTEFPEKYAQVEKELKAMQEATRQAASERAGAARGANPPDVRDRFDPPGMVPAPPPRRAGGHAADRAVMPGAQRLPHQGPLAAPGAIPRPAQEQRVRARDVDVSALLATGWVERYEPAGSDPANSALFFRFTTDAEYEGVAALRQALTIAKKDRVMWVIDFANPESVHQLLTELTALRGGLARIAQGTVDAIIGSLTAHLDSGTYSTMDAKLTQLRDAAEAMGCRLTENPFLSIQHALTDHGYGVHTASNDEITDAATHLHGVVLVPIPRH